MLEQKLPISDYKGEIIVDYVPIVDYTEESVVDYVHWFSSSSSGGLCAAAVASASL